MPCTSPRPVHDLLFLIAPLPLAREHADRDVFPQAGQESVLWLAMPLGRPLGQLQLGASAPCFPLFAREPFAQRTDQVVVRQLVVFLLVTYLRSRFRRVMGWGVVARDPVRRQELSESLSACWMLAYSVPAGSVGVSKRNWLSRICSRLAKSAGRSA